MTITGSGSAKPAGVSIPGNWDYSHGGITYNIYSGYKKDYPFPGPDVYVEGTAGDGANTESAASAMESMIALIVALCVVLMY